MKILLRQCINLRLFLLCVVLHLALLSACGQAPGPPGKAEVTQAIDGDTVELAGGARVRLLGIDAPEMARDGRPAEFLAQQSKDYVARLIVGKTVRLEYDRERYDRYGRLLAYLYLPDGAMVNQMLVRQGLARVYSQAPNLRHQETLNAAQQEAMAAGLGLWHKPLAQQQNEAYYLGNKNSLRLHRPNCPLAARMKPANRVRFTSLQEAYSQGYSPCRSCKP
ncbi:MAG: thermonuclease family protein [Deltaproteobacteria bacterium]|nr:thermonuclease family protein [Deltaproteobacteria bacterium]